MDFSQFDTETLTTIADSLRDAEESHGEAFYITGNPTAKEMADLYGLLADKVASGMIVEDRDDLKAIADALEASQENCLDLALFDVADEYATAASLVLSA